MAAKGSQLKNEITQKILTTFPSSFIYNDGKEIRINGMEDGQELQIKVTLTCAKTMVENAAAGSVQKSPDSVEDDTPVISSSAATPQEPSDEEKERLKTLLEKLGL